MVRTRPSSPGPLTGFTLGVTACRRADEQIELLERKGAMHSTVIARGPEAHGAAVTVTSQPAMRRCAVPPRRAHGFVRAASPPRHDRGTPAKTWKPTMRP